METSSARKYLPFQNNPYHLMGKKFHSDNVSEACKKLMLVSWVFFNMQKIIISSWQSMLDRRLRSTNFKFLRNIALCIQCNSFIELFEGKNMQNHKLAFPYNETLSIIILVCILNRNARTTGLNENFLETDGLLHKAVSFRIFLNKRMISHIKLTKRLIIYCCGIPWRETY